MAILYCTNPECRHVREIPNEHIGKAMPCPNCKRNGAKVYQTVEFIQKLLLAYNTTTKELRKFQQQAPPQPSSAANNPPVVLQDVDIFNTSIMSQSAQYAPIVKWFESRQIHIEINEKAVDTTGFFDEIALHLGQNYDLLQKVSDTIKRSKDRGYVTLNLDKYSQKDAEAIKRFCKELYDYSFLTKYFYNKDQKRAHLTLQTAEPIVSFFNGEWVEWFVFIKLLKFFYEKQVAFSCLRNAVIRFPNEDKHELDVFFLINDAIPVYIECKSGEFRPYLEKYGKLRQRLNIPKSNFLLFVLGLSDEQAQGLTSMYNVTLANETTFEKQVSALLP